MKFLAAGFIVWGFFALYIALTVLYLLWMRRANRRRDGKEDADLTPQTDR